MNNLNYKHLVVLYYDKKIIGYVNSKQEADDICKNYPKLNWEFASIDFKEEDILDLTNKYQLITISSDLSDKFWPPQEQDFLNIASSALDKSNEENIIVLVYWDNPTLMIFNPIHFANTDYVNKKYKSDNRYVEVIIGKQD